MIVVLNSIIHEVVRFERLSLIKKLWEKSMSCLIEYREVIHYHTTTLFDYIS